MKLLQGSKESQVAIVAMLNFYEKLALSIDHKMADEDVLKDFFRGIIRNTYNILKDYIYYKRKEMENQKIFDKFEELALRWS